MPRGTRVAEISKAEGNRQAKILVADGDAQARIKVAEAEAIKVIAQSISGGKGDPIDYLIAVRYIEALKEMVSGQGNKVVYLPYEATAILGAIGGIRDMLGKGKQ
jgi:regulator of protease activity HflC (stomatin/prohibitin superfamily)